MKSQELRKICEKIQQEFSESEEVTIEVNNYPFLDGDLSTFILKTECFYTEEGRNRVDKYIKRVERLLNNMGYDVEKKIYSCTPTGPIDGTIVAFRPTERKSD